MMFAVVAMVAITASCGSKQTAEEAAVDSVEVVQADTTAVATEAEVDSAASEEVAQ